MPALEVWIIAGLSALLVAGILGWLLWRRARTATRRSRPVPRRDETTQVAELVSRFQPSAVRVLTASERAVFETARRALPHHFVMPQVPLVRYLRAHDETQSSQWLRELSVLCADILVCDASARPVLAIDVHPAELSPRSARRHLRLKQLLESAGVKMLVLHEDRLPTVIQLHAMLEPLLPAEDEEEPSGTSRRPATGSRPAPQPQAARSFPPFQPPEKVAPAASKSQEPGQAEPIVVGKARAAASLLLPVPELSELLAEGDDIAARHPAMEPVSLTFFDEFEPLQREAQQRPH